jgi:hypothetical protein
MEKSKFTPVEMFLVGIGMLALVASFLTWYTESVSVLGVATVGAASDNGWEVGAEIIFVTLVMVYLAARSVLAATGAMRHMSHYKAYTALTAFATLVIFFRIGTYPKPAGVTTSLGAGDFVGLLAAVAATVVCFLAATHKGIGRVAPTESGPPSAGRGSN